MLTYTIKIVGPKRAVIQFDQASKQQIQNLLTKEPDNESSCYGRYEPNLCFTVNFDPGVEMDVKICGVNYEKGNSNLPWTEAVLFINGSEAGCSDPETELFRVWAINNYTVDVK